MKFQLITDHRGEFPVISMREALEVSTSGCYAWRGRPASKREMANRELTAKMKTAFEESGETYGSPRIYQVMRKLGLMRAEGLRAKQTRRHRATTRHNKTHRAAPNRLKWDFSAARPNQKWLTDITYILDYFEETGDLLPFRGYVLGQGSKPTRKGIILRLYEKGVAPPDIARITEHNLRAVDCYIKDYERAKALSGRRLTVTEISQAIGRGQRTVLQYHQVVLEFHPELATNT